LTKLPLLFTLSHMLQQRKQREITQVTAVRLPESMLHEIDRLADEDRRTRSDWIRLQLEDVLAARKRKKLKAHSK
jgi:metal-responsive CopG/Arc/MetJ family transcriptional regulator